MEHQHNPVMRPCTTPAAGEHEVPQQTTPELSRLALEELARHCTAELQRVYGGADASGVYGVELLRRAVGAESGAAAAVAAELYRPLIHRWVAQHPRFDLVGANTDALAHAAFSAFVAGLRSASCSRFPTLATALSYLKACVHAAIVGQVRDQQRAHTNATPRALQAFPRDDQQALWRHICRILPDPRDQLLARCVFALGMTPGEIAAAYGDYWRSAQEVTDALQRLRQALRSDAALAGAVRDVP